MPITAEQLEGIATGFHGIAEQHSAANGRVVPALWFIPDAGIARLVPMPNSVIDRDQIAEIARADHPSAILPTGESWLGSVTIPASTAAQLPLANVPSRRSSPTGGRSSPSAPSGASPTAACCTPCSTP